jgi:hypothetical protein
MNSTQTTKGHSAMKTQKLKAHYGSCIKTVARNRCPEGVIHIETKDINENVKIMKMDAIQELSVGDKRVDYIKARKVVGRCAKGSDYIKYIESL